MAYLFKKSDNDVFEKAMQNAGRIKTKTLSQEQLLVFYLFVCLFLDRNTNNSIFSSVFVAFRH